MPNSTTIASEQLDYPFLLLTHMVCADQQIHSEESKALHELASQTTVGQCTLEEVEKILAQDEHLLRAEDVASRVPPGQQSEAMRQILAIAYVDGFFSPLEREMVEEVARIWNWSAGEIQQLIAEAEGFTAKGSISNDNDQSDLSIGARLLKGAESILSRSLVTKLAEIAPENVGRRIEQLQREILLAGPEYDEAIRQCAAIATEDYKFAEVALKGAGSALTNLGRNIQQAIEEVQHKTTGKGQATTAKEVAKQLENTKKALTAEIIKEIESVRESLNAKQRALNHFSIAFMGKTKAGKSTLHAIITGGGWDAIGVGKQRTTRFNRVYEWKNIRIIDTPGIGAPDGKTDEEIALSVIEESDVICYVVTNDSIQETEFGFLRVLKEKAKPLIVLLNVKNNLRDSRRLEYFLKDPDKLFALEGQSGLGGHIERIHRYAKEHYANDYFDVVPALLLAAQLSCEPAHKERKDKLFKASRMQDFLEVLTRLSRTVRKERDRLRTKVQSIALEMSSAVAKEGTNLAVAVGSDQDFEMLNKQAELNVHKHYEKAETKLQEAVNAAAEDMRQEVEEVFQSNLVKAFVACLDRTQNVSSPNISSGMDMERIKSQMHWLQNIGETAGIEFTNLATRSFAKTAGQGFLRSFDVAGSGLHQGVLAVGKFVGFKFKPWQAVGIAKNIGNAAKFLGPVMALASVAVDAYQMHEEQERERQMAEARREITSLFQAIAKDLENQVEIQLWEFEKQVYGEIDKQISAGRQQEESAIAASNTWVKQLAEIRKDFELILGYITKATETPVA